LSSTLLSLRNSFEILWISVIAATARIAAMIVMTTTVQTVVLSIAPSLRNSLCVKRWHCRKWRLRSHNRALASARYRADRPAAEAKRFVRTAAAQMTQPPVKLRLRERRDAPSPSLRWPLSSLPCATRAGASGPIVGIMMVPCGVCSWARRYRPLNISCRHPVCP